jgi:hypothetical protein
LFMKKTSFHPHPMKQNFDSESTDKTEEFQLNPTTGEPTRPSPSESKSVLVSR